VRGNIPISNETMSNSTEEQDSERDNPDDCFQRKEYFERLGTAYIQKYTPEDM
jgi:hypothetical protein